ncbi:MAG TPA: tetratricopeptide repeat protein [Granulicella sp.]
MLLLLSVSFAPAQQAQPDRLLGNAIEAQQRGDLPTAIREYQKFLALHPKVVDARVNLGAALAESGRFDDAIAQYRLALPDAPDKEPIQRNIGLAYYKKGDLESARREFDELHTLRPADAQIAILLGDSDVRLGRGSEAVAMLSPMEASNASNPDFEYVLGTALLQAGERREGAQKLDQLAAQTQSPDAYLLAGSTFLDLNDFEHARTDLEAALRLKPELPHIYTLTGMARDQTGDPAAAEPAFREALRQDANDFNANLYLGSILYKRRAMDEAKPYLDRALQLNPTSSMARYEVAMWNSTSGHYEDSARLLEDVTRTDPNWLEPHIELATVYYRLHRPEDGAKERQIVAKLTAQQQSKGPAAP